MGLLHFQHRPVHHISSVHSWWQISIKLIWIALEVKLPQSSLPLRIWNPCRLLHHMPVIGGHISESAADDSWRESVINNCSADCVSQLHNSWVDPDKSTPVHKDAVSKVEKHDLLDWTWYGLVSIQGQFEIVWGVPVEEDACFRRPPALPETPDSPDSPALPDSPASPWSNCKTSLSFEGRLAARLLAPFAIRRLLSGRPENLHRL